MTRPANDKQRFCGRSNLYSSFMTQNQYNYLKIYGTFDFRFYSINHGKSQKCFFLVCKDLRLFTDLSPYDHIHIQDSRSLIWKGTQNPSPFYFLLLTHWKKSIGLCHSYFAALILSLPLPEMSVFIIIYLSFCSSLSSTASSR